MNRGPTVDTLRRQFIEFFVSKDHRVLPSASLIPASRSTLFTGAGMQPFVPAFRGEADPPAVNVVTVQKCARSGDIEEVGRTPRHGTFFEMMGNFSFGGYMKKEAIEWAWELVTEVWGIPRGACWATVYLDDDESEALWHKRVGLPMNRILRCGKEDNWWPQTVWDGPCGPDTEIHVDRGPGYSCDDPGKGPLSKGDRFTEIWNLVFQMYSQHIDGSMEPLPRPGIDTGLGLERLACVMQDVPTIFDTDIFQPILRATEAASREHGTGAVYGDSQAVSVAMRAIADHARAITFMIADKILPSNEGRGYVLRRILRRAFRYARVLGLTRPFIHKLVPTVTDVMAVGYPELRELEATTSKIVRSEEDRFCSTLEQGLARLEDLIAGVKSSGRSVLPGDEVFRLYDTYGFHKELTVELAEEAGLTVDNEGYSKALERQRSRSVFKYTESAAEKAFFVKLASELPRTEFDRDAAELESPILAVLGEDEKLESAEEGQRCAVVLPRTPFYAEKGGQATDLGAVSTETGELAVESVQEPVDGLTLHIGTVSTGHIEPDQPARAAIDTGRRAGIRRAHTATHLLHSALRRHLGPHVAQAGSLVEPDRLRFDFSHFEAVKPLELCAIERTVQENVLAAHPVGTGVTTVGEALAAGAIALFGEKYAEQVRMVSIGDVSKELCGGTHLATTGEVGPFVIVSESSVAAGTRRVEALTGLAAADFVRSERDTLHAVATGLGGPAGEVLARLGALQETVRELRKQVQELKRRGSGPSVESQLSGAVQVGGGVSLVTARLDDADADELSGLADRIVERDAGLVAVIASAGGGKVPIVCKAGEAAVAAGVDCGRLAGALARMCGGGGGGSAAFARAGGKQPEKLDEALSAAAEVLKGLLA